MGLNAGLFHDVLAFLHTGGVVLWLILAVCICLWALIFERILFLKWHYPQMKSDWLSSWNCRQDKHSVYAVNIRKGIISEARLAMHNKLSVIKMLINLCPLLGLLGTVTGMIHVFDVMAVTGTGNARAMASAISRATIPTMAGMVIAIAGLYVNRLLEQQVNDETHHLTDLLTYQ